MWTPQGVANERRCKRIYGFYAFRLTNLVRRWAGCTGDDDNRLMVKTPLLALECADRAGGCDKWWMRWGLTGNKWGKAARKSSLYADEHNWFHIECAQHDYKSKWALSMGCMPTYYRTYTSHTPTYIYTTAAWQILLFRKVDISMQSYATACSHMKI